MQNIDTTTARLYFDDGAVRTFTDQSIAYSVWLSLRRGIRCAFRGAGDIRPVYSWDYVDRL
jgi:hypothetical protein